MEQFITRTDNHFFKAEINPFLSHFLDQKNQNPYKSAFRTKPNREEIGKIDWETEISISAHLDGSGEYSVEDGARTRPTPDSFEGGACRVGERDAVCRHYRSRIFWGIPRLRSEILF